MRRKQREGAKWGKGEYRGSSSSSSRGQGPAFLRTAAPDACMHPHTLLSMNERAVRAQQGTPAPLPHDRWSLQ